MTWRPRPLIYEINTWVWLNELEHRFGQAVDLGSVPAPVWDELAELGVDAIWLMGLWERSPAGRKISLEKPDLLTEYGRALPGWLREDVPGSPYCIRDYVVDERLGGASGLAAARRQLSDRGLMLLADFVPNHTAPDHPWVVMHPERYIPGTREDLERDPKSFFAAGPNVVACGRDPYFPAWTDTAQVNAFFPELRLAAIDTLSAIARQCDGVRCDMAMLLINSIFERTWGARAGSAPAREYWREVIGAVKEQYPDFLFIAEAYWDLEWELQQQGFDYCYDKRLYDRLEHDNAASVRRHLRAGLDYQDRLIRFIENHDEPRAMATFGPEKNRAAAVAALTLPGAKLLHHGQFEGCRVKLPVQMGRAPAEAPDTSLEAFYHRLLRVSGGTAVHTGEWSLCETSGWPDNGTHENLVAWCWWSIGSRVIVVVNLSGAPAQGHVKLPWTDLPGRTWAFTDALSGLHFERDGTDLARGGLYVDLPAWGGHVLAGG